MIEYRHITEKKILSHYANYIQDAEILSILEYGLKNSTQARKLASFFWKMVDLIAIDADNKKSIVGQTALGSWCEDIMQTLRYHFIETGFISEWEDESDKAD